MVIGFIPARGGSKGIEKKNIVELGGKPLLVWSIESARKAGLDRIIVNTDDEEISKIAKGAGAEVVYVEPEEAKKRGIHQDDSPMYAVFNSEIPRIEPQPEIVVLLQPTVPFRSPHIIRTAVAMLARHPEYTSVLSAERIPDKYNPAQVIISTMTGLKMATGVPIPQRIKQRQKYPEAWIPDGSVYAFRPENLGGGGFYGDNPKIIENEGGINIDTPEDLREAEEWLKSSQK